VTSAPAETCRVDVWLWRARFFKTRRLAARVVEDGGVRQSRGGATISVDKPSRTMRAGDILIFPVRDRWTAVRIEGLGARRGPASEALSLYCLLDNPAGGPTSAS
jgi:ribosome-associated heat shock protein Hsp15